jgi:hypothetical protein
MGRARRDFNRKENNLVRQLRAKMDIYASTMPIMTLGTSSCHARSTRSRCTEEDDARGGVLFSTHTCIIHSSILVLVLASLFLEYPFSHQGKTTSHTLTHPSAPPLTTLPFPSTFPAALPSPSGSQVTTAPPIGAAPATCTYRENGGSREYTYTCVSSEVDARCVERGVKAREVMRAVWCVHLSVRFCVRGEG